MDTELQKDSSEQRGSISNEGIWIIVFGDLLMFSLFFCTYLFYRSLDTDVYNMSQAQLSLFAGLLNTIVLLTSSWFVIIGVQAARDGSTRLARSLFVSAAGLGIVFMVVKIWEYGEKAAAGISINTSEFFMFYFMLTGIHLVHVIVGTILLILISVKSVFRPQRDSHTPLLEGGAIFWHMVDIVWVVLFPLLYLVK